MVRNLTCDFIKSNGYRCGEEEFVQQSVFSDQDSEDICDQDLVCLEIQLCYEHRNTKLDYTLALKFYNNNLELKI